MNFFDLLSLSVTSLSLVQKFPQIYRIYRTKNVSSISTSSVLLEETAYTLVLTYSLWKNYPYAAFSEYIFLFVQDLFVLFFIWRYSTTDKDKQATSHSRSLPIYGMILFIIYLLVTLKGLLPDALINVSTLFVIPISASSKLVQLRVIFQSKKAGQVSRVSWLLATYGSVARLLTHLLQTQDMKMVLNSVISFILNGALVIACTIYAGNSTITKTTKTQ